MHSKHEDQAHHVELVTALADPAVDLVAFEKDKIRGAVRTDFILSAEIIAITLGTVAQASLLVQVTVLTGIAALMTVGVYGLVAGIVKLDDAGLYLSRQGGESLPARCRRSVGEGVLRAAPYLMKGLSIAGTAAMFLVGGGILTHGVPAAHHVIEAIAQHSAALPGVGGTLQAMVPLLADAAAGVVAGAVVLLFVSLIRRLWQAVSGRRTSIS